jgi:hypothetical protein
MVLELRLELTWQNDKSPFTSPLPTESTMSAKKRRKLNGVRRESRRPRDWTRWFQEGLIEADPGAAGSMRLRGFLWGQK